MSKKKPISGTTKRNSSSTDAEDRSDENLRASGRSPGVPDDEDIYDDQNNEDESDEQVQWPPRSAKDNFKEDAPDERTSLLSDFLRKLATAGVSAAFLTEESLRSFVSELKLPKETLGLLLQMAAKSKDEVVNRAGRELSAVVSKIDLVSEFSRFMETHRFKVQMEIEVVPKEPKNSTKSPPKNSM